MSKNQSAAGAVSPFDFKGHKVRVVEIEGEPWFVAADVHRLLDITQGGWNYRSLDNSEKMNWRGGSGLTTSLNCSGFGCRR